MSFFFVPNSVFYFVPMSFFLSHVFVLFVPFVFFYFVPILFFCPVAFFLSRYRPIEHRGKRAAVITSIRRWFSACAVTRILDLGQFDLGHFDLGRFDLGRFDLGQLAQICCVCLLCVSAVCVCCVCWSKICMIPRTTRPSAGPLLRTPPLRRPLPPPDRPKFRAFFSFSHSHFHFFFLSPGVFSRLFSSLGGLLVEFWWCFGRSGPQMWLCSPSGCPVKPGPHLF